MNERINRVLAKMEEKGLTQLLVSDQMCIRDRRITHEILFTFCR